MQDSSIRMLDEIQRLIYQSMTGCEVVIIAANNERASEYFERLKNYVEGLTKEMLAAAEELGKSMERSTKSFTDIIKAFNAIDEVDCPGESLLEYLRRCWYTFNNERKIHFQSIKRRIRCRWRQRESRRKLEGLSHQVILDELQEFG